MAARRRRWHHHHQQQQQQQRTSSCVVRISPSALMPCSLRHCAIWLAYLATRGQTGQSSRASQARASHLAAGTATRAHCGATWGCRGLPLLPHLTRTSQAASRAAAQRAHLLRRWMRSFMMSMASSLL